MPDFLISTYEALLPNRSFPCFLSRAHSLFDSESFGGSNVRWLVAWVCGSLGLSDMASVAVAAAYICLIWSTCVFLVQFIGINRL